MKLKLVSGKTVNVQPKDFIARGGGGEVFVLKDTAYKVCHQGQMPPEDKIAELAVLDRPTIIRPLQLLTAEDGRRGYTMQYVANAVPVTQIVPLAYRQRNNLTPDTMLGYVRQLQDGVQFVHSKRILVVDLNELNFLIAGDKVYHIDVDSYQTPHHPATAIMPSVRDYSVNQRDAAGHLQWSELSDWYSFAILSFQLFVGAHPFKGRHPRHPDPKTSMEACMRDGLSLLNPDTTFPKRAVLPFDVIPEVYRRWYHAVFEEGKRLLPPKDLVATVVVTTPRPRHLVGSNHFVIRDIFTASDEIRAYVASDHAEVVATRSGRVYYNGRPAPSPPVPAFEVGLAFGRHPFAAYLDGRRVCLHDILSDRPIDFQAVGDQIVSSDGRVYVRDGAQLLEVHFARVGQQVVAMPYRLLHIAEMATQVFPGVAIQRLFNAVVVELLVDNRETQEFTVPELEGYQVVDAKYENHVLMVVAVDRASGRYDRLVFRFDKGWSRYDLRTVPDIRNMGVNFAALASGKVASITENDELEIFRSTPGDAGLVTIADPAVSGDMTLTGRGSEVRFYRDTMLGQISSRS